jgi:hypothetical protein
VSDQLKVVRQYGYGIPEGQKLTGSSLTSTDLAFLSVRRALEGLLKRYTSLVNCGDCGNWDPETEPEVIQARRALKESESGA